MHAWRAKLSWLFGWWWLLCACGSGTAMERPAPVFAMAPRPRSSARGELGRLETGQAVHRERELTRGDTRYLGTVSYQLVKARSSTILSAFSQPESLTELLPNTKQVRLIEASDGLQRVELVQGNDWWTRLHRVPGARIRPGGAFLAGPIAPHDIDDAFGFFRAEPFDRGRTLMTVAVAVDIGSGWLRGLFASAVQTSILTTPGLIKRYTERLEAERPVAHPSGS